MGLFLRQIIRYGLLALGLSLGLMGFLSLWHAKSPLLHLLSIFAAPLLSVTVILCLSAWAFRIRPAHWILSLATVFFFIALWPQIRPQTTPNTQPSASLKVVFANLWIGNNHPEKLLPFIDAQKAELVALVETRPYDFDAMDQALSQRFPYELHAGETRIYSKYPLSHGQRSSNPHLLQADVATPQGQIHLGVAHFTRPWPYKPPKAHLAHVLGLIKALGPEADASKPILLVGDFNATIASAHLMQIESRLHLRPLSAPLGTWPSFLPAFLRIGIDNAYSSQELGLTDRLIGPDDGSDHRPIGFTLWWRKPQ